MGRLRARVPGRIESPAARARSAAEVTHDQQKEVAPITRPFTAPTRTVPGRGEAATACLTASKSYKLARISKTGFRLSGSIRVISTFPQFTEAELSETLAALLATTRSKRMDWPEIFFAAP